MTSVGASRISRNSDQSRSRQHHPGVRVLRGLTWNFATPREQIRSSTGKEQTTEITNRCQRFVLGSSRRTNARRAGPPYSPGQTAPAQPPPKSAEPAGSQTRSDSD